MILSTIAVTAGLLAAHAPGTPATTVMQSTTEAPDTLQAVTVVADRGVVVSRTDTVQISNSISITDAFASIPGLYVADYGGLAGLKSVSLRGMGSPHAAIYVDGVRVQNVQAGQADLGMFDLGSSSDIVIDYAQNSIAFTTAKPVFRGRSTSGKFKFRGGSFGTYEPSGRLDLKLSDDVSLSATVGGVLSRGDFPLADSSPAGSTAGSTPAGCIPTNESPTNASTTNESPAGSRRQNNDIQQLRAGLDSWGIINGGDWHAKAYYNGAQRGTPGTLAWPSTDRQNDRNAFVQGLVRKHFSPAYALHASAKLSSDELEYLGEWGNNIYRQTEAQLNTSHKFSICRWFSASLAADFSWDGLYSDLYNTARTTATATAAAAFHPARFKADIALEYAGTFDRGGQRRNILSPSMDLRWKVTKGTDLLAFARRAYRTPTFNELYYPGYGNPDLKPEDAWLTGLGVECRFASGRHWHFGAKADGFFNHLKNKIISAPTANDPNIWLPYNVGAVQMAGADVRASADFAGDRLNAGFSARYSYQSAIDKTPGSPTFAQQIPFISKHTVVLSAEAGYRDWSAAVSCNWRGERYDSSGRMPDYHTLDLSVGKEVKMPADLSLTLKIIARNLTDCRYELAGGYPMPGRAFYGQLEFKF